MQTTELRALAEAWKNYKLNNFANTAEHIGMLFVHKRNYERAATVDVVIALLDKVEQLETALAKVREAAAEDAV